MPRATHPDLGHGGTHKWWILATVGIGVFMATLDSSIVNVSLPAIADHFGTPLSGAVAWVIIAYLVVVAALLISAGRVADRIGNKPVWLVGLGLFTIGSTLCGLAISLGWLVGARALQGVGGAMMMALSPALLAEAFPRAELGRALGWNAVVVGLGVSLGPTLGGIITEHLSWRWIFFVNLPVGVIAIGVSSRVLPRVEPHRREPLDPLGALLLAVCLGALTLGASFGSTWGWASTATIASFAASAAALLSLTLVERRSSHPLVGSALLRSRVVVITATEQFLAFLGLFAVAFLLPFFLIELRGFDPQRAGLILTPLPLSMAVLAPFAGGLADRHGGAHWLRPLGLAISGVGLYLVARFGASTTVTGMIVVLAIVGCGQALFFPPNNAALLGAAPPERRGVASGLLATCRAIGQSLSVALSSSLFGTLGGSGAGRAIAVAESQHAVPTASSVATFVDAYRDSLLVHVAIVALATIVALLPLNKRRP